MRPTFSLRVLFAVMTVAALFVAGVARPTWPLTWTIVVLAGLSFGAALIVGLVAAAHRAFALTYSFVGALALASILHPQVLWRPMLLLPATLVYPMLWLYPLGAAAAHATSKANGRPAKREAAVDWLQKG